MVTFLFNYAYDGNSTPACFSKQGAQVWLAKPGEDEHIVFMYVVIPNFLQDISTFTIYVYMRLCFAVPS